MIGRNISHFIATDVAVAPAAAGQTAVNGNTIDVKGFQSVVFYVMFGSITTGAVTGIKIQAGDASDASDMADVTDAAVSVPDTADNKGCYSVEIHRPTKRYLRAVVTRSTQDAAVAGGVVLLGRPAITPPATQPNSVNVAGGTRNAPTVLVSVP